MKKLLFYITPFVVVGFAACKKDLLETVPRDQLSEVIVWTDANAAEQFVNSIYLRNISGFERPEQEWGAGVYMLDAASDDGDLAFTWSQSQSFNDASFNPANSPLFVQWGRYYGQVRAANLALENLDKVTGNDAKKQRLKGEVYFLRAFVYHDLLRFYGTKTVATEGGVPLLDKTLKPGDNFKIPRAGYSETVDFIIKDIDAAMPLLPNKNETVEGRATKGAAMALKSRVLLYAERWAEAATAARAVMTITPGYSLFPDYENIFLTKNNSEIIFAKKYNAPAVVHGAGGPGAPGFNTVNLPAYGTFGGWGGTNPTQNLVDAYEGTDGRPIASSTVYNAADPYKNRDPRFYATVLHNGSVFSGKPVETFDGGANSKAAGPDGTNTGYYLRKFLDPRPEKVANLYPSTSDQDWIFFRYAEVLLNYAEAQNEAAGPDATVYNAINMLRTRPGVNMPALPVGLSKDEMRQRIRNERRVELAFEEHRFFDVRRWGIAKQVLNGPAQGMKITKTGNTFTYTRFTFENRVFLDKMIVLPIPQAEIDKNPAAKQIAGW